MWGYLKTWKAQRFNVAYDWHRINIYTLQQRLKSINSKDYRIAQSALCLFCSSFLHWKLTPWTQSPGFLTVWHQIAGFGQWEALAGVSQDKREGWGICFHFLPCLAAFSICVWYHPQLQLPSGHTYIKLPILLGLNWPSFALQIEVIMASRSCSSLSASTLRDYLGEVILLSELHLVYWRTNKITN